ncbi:TetR/AcrR family transcriptional regulator [Sinomonas sp. ASV322]|uniref:TetR/AcrR family transcriptional regulator n=1 Tax=Sinomonas sp. ASV322 TaxID=3041920 RepID=UPI0027DD7790|nr:TetR/AcrR family transcriptional regulator [Sinomonas sp. ASV322]MDQ4503967.1 TetR/AcrR family transcriptional regulator [Sinomonas sp. ASV322]
MKSEGGGRPYVMRQRAASAEETRVRLLDAALGLFVEIPLAQITLAQVADRAGVTVQTVIRRFGDKESLFASAAEHGFETVANARDAAPADNLAAALENLAEHYETTGQLALKMLAEEHASAFMREVTGRGRGYHRGWCSRVFANSLAGLTGADRDRRLAQFVALCDVYTWKLLRLDAGLSRRQYLVALTELLEPLVRRP